jgi:hypothetical protein
MDVVLQNQRTNQEKKDSQRSAASHFFAEADAQSEGTAPVK